MLFPKELEGLYCPFWRKKMSATCPTCPLFAKLEGPHPETGKLIDNWTCALALLPVMVHENCQQSRQAGASADKVATEVAKLRDSVVNTPPIVIESMNGHTKLIEG